MYSEHGLHICVYCVVCHASMTQQCPFLVQIKVFIGCRKRPHTLLFCDLHGKKYSRMYCFDSCIRLSIHCMVLAGFWPDIWADQSGWISSAMYRGVPRRITCSRPAVRWIGWISDMSEFFGSLLFSLCQRQVMNTAPGKHLGDTMLAADTTDSNCTTWS